MREIKMPIIKLTESYIGKNLQCPEGKKRIEYCDKEVPGLYVEVRSSSPGQGTYYLRYKNTSGKTTHQKIARTTEKSLADARKKAKALKSEIVLGGDPRGEMKAMQSIITFSDLFDNHYLPHVKPRKRSWKRDEELYRLRIRDKFGKKQVNQITRQQIQLFHTALLDEGLAPATCNHHIKLIRHALNLAIEWEMLEKNPASRVPLFKEDNKVEHYLNPEELEKLLTVLNTDENRMVCFIALFLLSTGARLNEALRATWSQVDPQNRIWRIPASNSKSRRVRSVPLNDSALDILRQLDTKEEFDYLFINRKTGKPYVSIQRPWGRLRKKAGAPHLRIHDLRHQYASFLVNSGRTLYEVQQILGHSDPIVTQRYAHLSTKTLQDAANSASDMIKGATAA
jgi:integrase